MRGETVSLLATGVVDDNNAVNDVIFRLDANANGTWDDSDPILAYGSKDGETFSATVRTDAGWKLGANTILARAYDNFGLASAVKTASVSLLGLPTGPFADDSYENNDTEEDASDLHGGDLHDIQNLALTPNDPDFYKFLVLGDAGRIQVDINFTQEAYQGVGVPVGDLTLELRRLGINSSFGFSNLSTSANGHEQVVFQANASAGATIPNGWWVAIVRGADQNERNPSYSLKVQITPQAGAPVAGPLTASAYTVVQGDPITLSMTGITGVPADHVDGVHFYDDFNNDGQMDADSEYLGSDFGFGDGPNGEYVTTASTANWPLGANRIIAFVSQTNNGFGSLAQDILVTVLPNNPPTIGGLSTPATVIQGGTASLSATAVADTDPGGSVARVAFTLDTNGNGVLDGDDTFLGSGTKAGDAWSLAADTTDWPLGAVRVFAQAVDNLGLASVPSGSDLQVVASDNVRPTIGSFVVPDSLIKGVPLPLLASQVIDPNGDNITVKFYADSNSDGEFDAGDALLGLGVQSGHDWSVTVPSDGFVQGPLLLFAEARDDGVPSFGQVVSQVVTVIDTTGPKVVAQVPSAPIKGSLDTVRITFDEPINPTTFTTADITSFSGPGGAIVATSVTAVAGSGDTQFDIAFPRQTATGAYALSIGPDILDLADNPMNQDGDGTNGEAGQDAYALSFSIEAALAEFSWAEAVGGATRTESGNGIATDASGNTYVTGQYTGTVDFDPGPSATTLTSVGGSQDIFVAKYNTAGGLVWAKSVGGTSNSELGQSIAVDGSGNVYVTGYFAGTADFDPGPGTASLTSAGPNAAFLLKLDGSGNYQWARQMGGSAGAIGTAVAADASGAVILGSYIGTADIGGLSRTSAGDRDLFVARWNSAGAVQWADSFGGALYDRGDAVAMSTPAVTLTPRSSSTTPRLARWITRPSSTGPAPSSGPGTSGRRATRSASPPPETSTWRAASTRRPISTRAPPASC